MFFMELFLRKSKVHFSAIWKIDLNYDTGHINRESDEQGSGTHFIPNASTRFLNRIINDDLIDCHS